MPETDHSTSPDSKIVELKAVDLDPSRGSSNPPTTQVGSFAIGRATRRGKRRECSPIVIRHNLDQNVCFNLSYSISLASALAREILSQLNHADRAIIIADVLDKLEAAE